MTIRLPIIKTHKLFINGQFPRSESGRSLEVRGASGEVIAHACNASRKDLRDAVVAARAAQDAWSRRAAYNRGQIFYRMAEMLDAKRAEFVDLLNDTPAAGKTKPKPKPARPDADREVSASVDRLVAFAGWADKYSQILGCHNPVNGPFYNFTVAEATGVVGIVAPDRPALLAMVSLIAPAICAGNTVVALASETTPLPACVLAEVCATSDVPSGVVNILTGTRAELVPQFSEHREVDAVVAASIEPDHLARLRLGAANNLKRVVTHALADTDWYDDARCESPWAIEPTVEMKTIWHPASA
ncbi:MAG: aldehyde dehydrogenase family protein [Planctomycetes bacterium]|nr:aldehyde dehydrogenase family protein [Planctomycetota bacterium]